MSSNAINRNIISDHIYPSFPSKSKACEFLSLEEPHKSSLVVINGVCVKECVSLVQRMICYNVSVYTVSHTHPSVVYALLLLSSAGGGDHGVFGLREERISCLWFLLSLSPLHAPLALSGRARPLGHCRAGTAVNHISVLL